MSSVRALRYRASALSVSAMISAWSPRNREAASVRRASASAIGPWFRLKMGSSSVTPMPNLLAPWSQV